MRLPSLVSILWQMLRQMSGDDAYERYLAHWRAHHGAQETEPLSPKDFFKAEQKRKWDGIKRCC
jgi:uncharacterized short protein YbdD (DUF466 family)